MIWESRQPYAVLRHNCGNVVYDILRSYGTNGLLDPVEEPAPNDWYDALPGRSYLIADYPTIPLHVHQMSKRTLLDEKILLRFQRVCRERHHPGACRAGEPGKNSMACGTRCSRDLRTLFVETKARVTGATRSLSPGATTRPLMSW